MPLEPTPAYANRLQCVECGRVSREDERGRTAQYPERPGRDLERRRHDPVGG